MGKSVKRTTCSEQSMALDERSLKEPLDKWGWIDRGLYLRPELKREAIGVALEKLCESPIEIQLGLQLILLLGDTYEVVPQYKIDKYRMDFAIISDSRPILFVECDGEGFHCSSAQIENDRRKDMIAEDNGIGMIRFSGKQIFKAAESCASFVDEHIDENPR